MKEIGYQICNALVERGYHGGKMELNRAGYDQLFVSLDGEPVGVYDLIKHEFVDRSLPYALS